MTPKSEHPHAGSTVALILLAAILFIAITTRFISHIDPPPYTFHPVMVSP